MSASQSERKRGTLIVIGGPMFAGKTSEIVSRTKGLTPGSYIVVKPSMDTRYATNECVTHNGNRVSAINVDAQNPVLPKLGNEIETIFIDELNFFAFAALWSLIQEQLDLGRNVVGVGLLYDVRLQPFGATLLLSQEADQFIEISAVCDGCGGTANHTYSKKHFDGQVALGAEELYGPCCQACWAKLNH